MALEELSITVNPGDTDEREYQIYPIREVTISSTKEAFSIAPPGLGANENILLGISGMNADITIEAQAWDDGSDRANGTHSSTVTSVEEQNTYLEDEIHAPEFATPVQPDHLTGAEFNDEPVFLENGDVTPISFDSPKWKPITLRLRRGQSV